MLLNCLPYELGPSSVILSPIRMYSGGGGGGYYSLVIITPSLRPQTLHLSRDNLKKCASDCFEILYV